MKITDITNSGWNCVISRISFFLSSLFFFFFFIFSHDTTQWPNGRCTIIRAAINQDIYRHVYPLTTYTDVCTNVTMDLGPVPMSTELNRIVGKPIYDRGWMMLLSLSPLSFIFATQHQIFDIWFEFKYLIRQRETEAHGMMGNGTIRLIVICDRYARYKYRLVCEKMLLVFGQINDWWYRLQRYWSSNRTVISYISKFRL